MCYCRLFARSNRINRAIQKLKFDNDVFLFKNIYTYSAVLEISEQKKNTILNTGYYSSKTPLLKNLNKRYFQNQ